MSVIATAVKHMLAAGMAPSDIVRAVEELEADLAHLLPQRSKGALRQERYREGAVTSVEWEGLRTFVFRRDEYRCVYCGTPTDRPQCDHVIPRSRGGPDAVENLVTACKPCNSAKKDRTPEEWRP